MALRPFSSYLLADTGISMGDEGKGRLVIELVDELTRNAGGADTPPVEVVLKVNGGANSGHTAAGLKFNLVPSAAADPRVPCLAIGSGVVADPRKFVWETTYLEANGASVLSRLLIDERTLVSDLTHRLLDLAWENYRVNVLRQPTRGTTGRGITPAYSDEVNPFQIWYLDFLGHKDAFAEKLKARADRACRTIQHTCRVSPEDWFGFFDTLTNAESRANAFLIENGHTPPEDFDFTRFLGPEPFALDLDTLVDTYWETGRKLVPCIGDVRERILKATRNHKYVIGEFGQSYWLDKRFGFSPNLTASHTFTPEFFQSANIPIQPIHNIGVCKAYDTKVGTHNFIAEMPARHPLGNKLRTLEFGTSTGRQRMVGWFDAVEKGDALRYGGFQDMMLNKLDALSYSGEWIGGELLICVAYRTPSGETLRAVPRNPAVQSQLQPVYRQLPGWHEDISTVRHFDDLPHNAKVYVATVLQAIFDVAYRDDLRPDPLPNLRYLGVGPDPSQIINDIPEPDALLALAR